MKNTRNWVTPVTTGVFLVVAVTGVVMFFHASSPIGRTLHEWLGWALVAGGLLHAITNWTALKGHWGRARGKVILALFLAVLVVALKPEERGGATADGTRGALMALTRAPLRDLAPIAGRDAASLANDLRQAGFPDATVDSSGESLAGPDRGKSMRVLGVIFSNRAPTR